VFGRASGLAGFGPKSQNRAAGARLWVRCWEWLWRAIEGGGGVVRTRWGWWRGCALDNARWGAGLGLNVPNQAVMARVWAGFGLQVDMWGPMGSLPPLSW
jgi:hypothetical protein